MNCDICGAPLFNSDVCPFDVSEDKAPWRGDYSAMSEGIMTHLQHQVSVARWLTHSPRNQSKRALEHSRRLTRDFIGVQVPLCSLPS